MEGKEKMVEIYNAVADKTLKLLNHLSDVGKERGGVFLNDDVLEMVRTTQSLYETINHATQPEEIDAKAVYEACIKSFMEGIRENRKSAFEL